ncbi:hypothetical protein FK513_28720, partial [Klebsiella pneumoniae]|uniref:hypothetical protein n=1 Tax=Klebsiella pneumoniae TaxID=573 RepID=UPI00210C30D8
ALFRIIILITGVAAIQRKFLRDNELRYDISQILTAGGARQIIFNAMMARCGRFAVPRRIHITSARTQGLTTAPDSSLSRTQGSTTAPDRAIRPTTL